MSKTKEERKVEKESFKPEGKDFDNKPELVDPGDVLPPMQDAAKEILVPPSDSTATLEFSFVLNPNYSTEIIQSAQDKYNKFKRLQRLKARKNMSRYYEESRDIIISYCRDIEHITIHNNLFLTHYLIDIGTILNDAEKTFKSKGEYMKWIRDNFEDRHLRHFQQAKQLDEMGRFAREYAALGKTRLLMLESLRKKNNLESCYDLFSDNPFPALASSSENEAGILIANPFNDTSTDHDGDLMKIHADAYVTHQRLLSAGISCSTFEHSRLIAHFEKQSITQKMALRIKGLLDKYETPEEKINAFEDLVADGLQFPSDRTLVPARDTLNKILVDLNTFFGNARLDDQEWLVSQRIDGDILKSAYVRMTELISKLVVEEDNDEDKNKVKEENSREVER